MTDGPGTTFIGDLLVQVGGGPSGALDAMALPARAGGSAWQASAVGAQSAPGPGWRGYGLRSIDGPEWSAWLLGEVLPESATGFRAALDPEALVGELRGSWLLVARHASGQWHAWTDRFGTLHAYYGRSGAGGAGGVLGTFSPAVAAVASARNLDWAGIAGWAGFGFFPTTRTQFDDVSILPPASHAVFGPDGSLEHITRWQQWRHEPDATRSFDATVDAFAGQFASVMRAQHEAFPRLAVPISGGLDSRSTVAALTTAGAAPAPDLWSYSYGWSATSPETRIARQLADARGLPFEAFTIGPYLWDRIDQACDSLEGMQDLSPPRQLAVADQLAQRSDHVVAAHWGDVWLDDMGWHGPDDPSREELVDAVMAKVAKRGRQWLLENLCRPHLPAGTDPADLLREFVGEGLDEVARIADPDARIKAFKTDHWSFRWTTASLRAYRCGSVPVLPFYDPQLADFFATVPTSFVAGRRLQLEYLRRYAPDLARVKWQAFDANLFRVQRFNSWMIPERALKRVRRQFRPDPTAVRNWEVQFGGAGRDELRARLLDPGVKLHDVIDPVAVADLLADFDADPSGANGYTVSMLLTFAVWLARHG